MRSILNVYLPSSNLEFSRLNDHSWRLQYDQMECGYPIPVNATDTSLDVPEILRSHGHFTDWELGPVGYGSQYISVPRDAS